MGDMADYYIEAGLDDMLFNGQAGEGIWPGESTEDWWRRRSRGEEDPPASSDEHLRALAADARRYKEERRLAKVSKPQGALKAEPPAKAPLKKALRGAKTADPDAGAAMVLPLEKTQPLTRLGAFIMLLFGERKIGKTTMLSMFPKTIFLMFEPGDKALSIYRLPLDKGAFSRWSEFKQAVTLLVNDKRFDTVVLDVIDLAFKLCEKHVTKKLGVEHVSEVEWGKGWSALRDEFAGEINRLVASGKGVIFISHATERKIETRSGEAYDMIVSTMPKQAREMIEGGVDIWGYYGYDGQNRVLHIQGSDHISAGHRLKDNFKFNGKAIRTIDMGTSEEEAYKNFTDAFNNKYEPKPEPAPRPKAAVVKKAVVKKKV